MEHLLIYIHIHYYILHLIHIFLCYTMLVISGYYYEPPRFFATWQMEQALASTERLRLGEALTPQTGWAPEEI